MRILHVEDNVDWFERIVRKRLEGKGLNSVFHAENKEDAIKILVSESIDYLIVDLAIPGAGGESAEYEHGVALVHQVQNDFPGMPILILTGQATEEAAQQFEDQERVSFWDGSKRDLVKIRPKRHLPDAIELVLGAAKALDNLNDIDVYSDNACTLTPVEKRIFQIYCINTPGDSYALKYNKVSGGLSGAKVYSVQVMSSSGQCLQIAIGKIASSADIDIEVKNADLLVQLPIGLAPVLLGVVCAGCGNTKGVFFQLAEQHDSSYFDVLRSNDELACSIVNRLRTGMNRWSAASQSRPVLVEDIRRFLVPDRKFNNVLHHFDSDVILEFEQKKVTANFSIIHKDLHGENILVSKENEPVLIDYGDMRADAPSLIDPITLWLSPFFHPSVCVENHYIDGSASGTLIDGMYNVFGESYSRTGAVLQEWIQSRAVLRRDILSVIYAYSLRQLTFCDESPDTVNTSLAIGLIEESIRRWSA